MVCAADHNGDGKMGVDEFKVLSSKIETGDNSWVQDGERCILQQEQQERQPTGLSNSGNLVSINLVIFTLASLMAILWK